MPNAENFLQSLQPAVDLFLSHAEKKNKIRIVTHNDADGLSCGGILSVAVLRSGGTFRTSGEKRLDEKLISKLAEEEYDLLIFSDFGSGYLDIISQNLKGDIIIFDHHLCIEGDFPNITHVNPMLHKVDGAREISASGVCYLFARKVSEVNMDLAPLALVGGLGDQQDKGTRKSLVGLNTMIEEEAIESHLLDKRSGLIFYGYETRPLAKAISYTTQPFIPGLSGSEGNCVAFLKRLGLDLEKEDGLKSLADLDASETRLLFSSLSSHMVNNGCSSDAIHQLIGTIYTFKLEEPSTPLRNGREYSSLLNACGRMGKQGLGISICLGDRGEALEEAQEVLDEYRWKIAQSLDWVQSNERVDERESIYVINAEDNIDDTVIGVVSGILLGQGILKNEKPIISTAWSEDDTIKVSARGLESLVEKGLHMGKVMQEAAELVEGAGGGHDIAAGAYIPLGREDDFLSAVDGIVQMYLRDE
jgi:RecJ-like exonuclease